VEKTPYRSWEVEGKDTVQSVHAMKMYGCSGVTDPLIFNGHWMEFLSKTWVCRQQKQLSKFSATPHTYTL
jgi:hypothetical protein